MTDRADQPLRNARDKHPIGPRPDDRVFGIYCPTAAEEVPPIMVTAICAENEAETGFGRDPTGGDGNPDRVQVGRVTS